MEKVGLGIMGAAMAGNLSEASRGLVVHNRTKTKAEQVAQHGALVADSLRGGRGTEPSKVAARLETFHPLLWIFMQYRQK